MSKCSNCDFNLAESAKFCDNCGTPVAAPTAPTAPPPMPAAAPIAPTAPPPMPTAAPTAPIAPPMGQVPPQMGQAAPPPMGQAAPPPMGQAAPPPMGQAAPPPMGQAAPPPMGQAAPPPIGQVPPQMGQAAPPPMGQVAPPPMGRPVPPPINQGGPKAPKKVDKRIFIFGGIALVVFLALIIAVVVIVSNLFKSDDGVIADSISTSMGTDSRIQGGLQGGGQGESSELSDYWDGTWYGIISLYETDGKYEEFYYDTLDAYIVVDVDADGVGQFSIYADDGFGEPFIAGDCYVETGESAGLYATSVNMGDVTLDTYDWMMLPSPDFEDKYTMSTVVTDSDGDMLDFIIYMKRYGADWNEEIDSEFHEYPEWHDYMMSTPEPYYTIDDVTNVSGMDTYETLGGTGDLNQGGGQGGIQDGVLSTGTYWYGTMVLEDYVGPSSMALTQEVWGEILIEESTGLEFLQLYDTSDFAMTEPMFSAYVTVYDDGLSVYTLNEGDAWMYDNLLDESETMQIYSLYIDGELSVGIPYDYNGESFFANVVMYQE